MTVATKHIIFLVQNLKRVVRDFTPPVPETFADCRWSEWGVGVGSGLALTSIDDARCRPARAVGLRDTLLPILGTVALATARPRGGTVAMTHAAGRIDTPGPTGSRRDHGTGSRRSEGSQGGRPHPLVV